MVDLHGFALSGHRRPSSLSRCPTVVSGDHGCSRINDTRGSGSSPLTRFRLRWPTRVVRRTQGGPPGGAPMASRPERLLRGDGSPLSASFLELFFDLAFVLALSQLAEHLLHDLTVVGALRTALLLTGVWWIWVTTTWFADWYDPQSPLVRWLLVGAALGSLLAGVAIPQALDGRGLLFAGAYVSVHVARGAFTAVGCAATLGRAGRCGSSAGSASPPYRGWPVGSCRSGACRSGCSPSPSTSPARDSAGPLH
ncbi:low temperature requirement protein A [Micromonospora sp. M12]